MNYLLVEMEKVSTPNKTMYPSSFRLLGIYNSEEEARKAKTDLGKLGEAMHLFIIQTIKL